MQLKDRGYEVRIERNNHGFYVAFIDGEKQGAENTTLTLALQSATRVIDRKIIPTIATKLGRTSQIRGVKV